MLSERLILVDPEDNKIGEYEKIRAHQYGMLHRAFSVVLFRERNNTTETLLQQRSIKKYHGGGLWTNTCCSHPHVGEDLTQAAHVRLKEEMGIETELQEVGKFHYIAKLDHGMTENEIDHVFIGNYEVDNILFNSEEVDDFLWMDIDVLQNDLLKHPEKFTPWFTEALNIASNAYPGLKPR